MRHLKKGRKFGRVKKQRTALLRNLAASLFLHKKIKTTEAKAKELRPIAEKYIEKAKKGVADKTKAIQFIRILKQKLPNAAVQELIKNIAPQYETRHGGYARIIKLGARKSDSAKMAIIELV